MLTPIDIQNHNLKTGVRGYSKKETDDFLESILESYETLYKENHELKEKVSSLSEGIQYYKNMENTLQKALVLAEKTSAETQEAAKSAADAMIHEAEAKADAIKKEAQAYVEVTKSNANRELDATRDHVRKLVRSYENYRLQFKKLAEAQLEMLDSEAYSIFAPELQELLEDAPSADEAMEAKETVGINNEGPFLHEPKELTEEERLAETKDLSAYLKEADEMAKQAEKEEEASAKAEEENAEAEQAVEESEEKAEEAPKTEDVVEEEEKEEAGEQENTENEEDSPFTFIDPE